MFRVLLIQRVLAPYRVAFFDKLSSSLQLEVAFAYGAASADRTIVSPDPPDGWKVIHLSNWYWWGTECACWQRGLLSHLRPDLFDVAIAEFNSRIVSNVAACLLARRRGIPLIWWGHGLSSMRSSALGASIRKRLLQLSSAAILYDNAMRERLVSYGVQAEKLFVAHNSVDTAAIAHLLQSYASKTRFRVVYIGRLIPQKKVDLLIRGFALARPRLAADTRLTIIGDGPKYSELRSLVSALGLAESVEFLGAIYDEDRIAPYFAEALLSASPGCIGLAAIHSLAYGVPLLVADDEPHGPEFNALEAGKTVVFFRSDSVEDLAEEMLRLIADSPKREEMARMGLEVVAQGYGLEAMVSSFEAAVHFATHRRSRQ